MRNLDLAQTAKAPIGAASAAAPAPRAWSAGLIGAAVGVGIGALLGLAIATTVMPAPAVVPGSEAAGAADFLRQIPVTEQLRRHLLRENGGAASAGSVGDDLRAHLLRENGGSAASAGSVGDDLRAHLLRENGGR